MNREETKKAIEVMQAYVDGKTIQVYDDDHLTWIDSIGPAWNWNFGSYRVKPEPLECWITVFDGRVVSKVHASEEDARKCVNPDENPEWTVKKVVIE